LKFISEFFLQLPKQHRIIIITVSTILLLALLSPSEKSTTSTSLLNKKTDGQSLEVGKRYQIALPQGSNTLNIGLPSISTNIFPRSKKMGLASVNIQSLGDISWQTAKVKNGDSLARIFKRLGFSAQTTYAVSTAKGKNTKLLKKLNIGDKIRIASNKQQQYSLLGYSIQYKSKSIICKC